MSELISRRTLLRTTAGSLAAAAVATGPAPLPAVAAEPSVLSELDDKIRAGMAAYGVPGVAVGLFYRGREYIRGYGVTDLGNPVPVDGDTVFRVASTTKTFTGTTVMRLVERGRLDLRRTVRSYLPGFRTADAAASARVTVREVLNHSAGWLGDYFTATGEDDGALARYIDGMSVLPQLTAPGTVFAYNNAALGVAGRLIEVATGRPYEEVVSDLVLNPLRLRHSGFSVDAIPGASVAVPHVYDESGAPVSVPAYFALPRAINPAGGLISSARDQLRWARFHLGDGRPLLTSRSLRLMQSHPGPGGTLFVELNGAGVTWMLRPTAEGPTVVQHGGDLTGEHSGFIMVPERGFALTVLTNAEGGPALLADLFAGDWALSRFAGVHNLPATPRALPASALAGYAGHYVAEQIGFQGERATIEIDLVPAAGQLSGRVGGEEVLWLAFYRKDYTLVLDPSGAVTPSRINFVRGADGTVAWVRYGGRLFRRGPLTTLHTTASRPFPRPGTLPYPG